MISFTHDDLCLIAEKWLINTIRCGVVLRELTSYSPETPDAIGWRQGVISYLVECKISRSDFLADKRKMFRRLPDLGMGFYRYFMCQTGLIKPDELPENWGLVYVSDKGKPQQIVAAEQFVKRNMTHEMYLYYSALRRLRVNGGMDLIYKGLKQEA